MMPGQMARVPRPAAAVRLLRRSTLRTQLALLYAGVFTALALAVLGASGLLIHSSSASSGSQAAANLPNGRTFDVLAAVIFLVSVLIAIVLGWLIAGRLLRPLRTITSTARDISATNLSRRLGLGRRDDEFAELGDTLDDLFGRLEASFESQRHFVASASHELRTPLAAERALLQVALADPGATAETLRATCQELLALGEQQERLIEALLTLASSERGTDTREPVDLAELAWTVLADRRPEADRRGLEMTASLAPAPASGDPALAERLVANLVDNAIRHNRAGGWLRISTATAGGRAVLSVSNSGTVIPPGEVDRIIEPFQRLGTERVRHGSGHGLGLAIVRAIAGVHGAALTVTARPDGGLAIDVSFPPQRP